MNTILKYYSSVLRT